MLVSAVSMAKFLKSIMSFVVRTCLYVGSLSFFNVLMPLWSIGLFTHPEIAPVLSLMRSFCIKGILTKMLIGLGLVAIAYKKFMRMLESASRMYKS